MYQSSREPSIQWTHENCWHNALRNLTKKNAYTHENWFIHSLLWVEAFSNILDVEPSASGKQDNVARGRLNQPNLEFTEKNLMLLCSSFLMRSTLWYLKRQFWSMQFNFLIPNYWTKVLPDPIYYDIRLAKLQFNHFGLELIVWYVP
jgi:hypothetical protein